MIRQHPSGPEGDGVIGNRTRFEWGRSTLIAVLLACTLFAATGATSAASKGNGKGKPAIALMLKSGSELCAVQAKVKRAPKRSRAKFQANSDGRWKPRLARRIESGNSRFEVGCAEFGLTPGPH